MEKDKESGEIENAPSAGKIKIEREEICVEGNTCSVDIEKSEYASNMVSTILPNYPHYNCTL